MLTELSAKSFFNNIQGIVNMTSHVITDKYNDLGNWYEDFCRMLVVSSYYLHGLTNKHSNEQTKFWILLLKISVFLQNVQFPESTIVHMSCCKLILCHFITSN